MIMRHKGEIAAYVQIGDSPIPSTDWLTATPGGGPGPPLTEADPSAWYQRAKAHLDAHYRGLQIIIHLHGTRPHLHWDVEGAEMAILEVRA